MGIALHHRARGVTLIELLVGVAILAALLALGVPSMREWMMSQRVSAIASELITDLQLARSESITRKRPVQVSFRNTPELTCYTVHTMVGANAAGCDCTLPAGTACSGTNMELKTVTVPTALGVTISSNKHEKYEANAELSANNVPLAVLVSDGGSKRVQVLASPFVQRPSACVPSGSTVPGIPACP